MTVATVETDGDILAQAAYAEMDGTAAPEKKPDEKPAELSEEKPAEDKAEPSEEVQPSEEEKQAKEAEDKKLLEANDDDLDEQQKAKKAEIVAAKEVAEKPEEEVVREHALKHNLTMDEAKEDISKTKAIIEKYKSDPVELARALRHTQSGYDQLKSKEAKPQIVYQKDPSEEIREYAKQNSEKIVENFRKKFPAKSEMMSDEAILEDAVAQAERDYEIWAKGEKEKITRDASVKREQLLSSLAEGDKRFLPDIKAVLSRMPDNQVVHESFDIKDLVYHARGAYYTPERVKAMEEAAFKRGKEDPKILGVKTPTSGGPAPKSSSGGATGGLNDNQKHRALEMFSAEDGYTEEQAYQAFRDTFKEELKKDRNFM